MPNQFGRSLGNLLLDLGIGPLALMGAVAVELDGGTMNASQQPHALELGQVLTDGHL